MNLQETHLTKGAELADDSIPLHYGDLHREYRKALENAVLLDRSHEGRIRLSQKDRFDFLNRMSTNKLLDMNANEARPTIFINAQARIIDRVVAFAREEYVLIITEPGRSNLLQQFLQSQIFFNDQVTTTDITTETHQFALHGPKTPAIMEALVPGIDRQHTGLYGKDVKIADVDVFVGQRKPLIGQHWVIIVPVEQAVSVYEAILEAGHSHGLIPAGSLTYNTLRIRAGRPAGRELSTDYIPLEVGLWDEISFQKGCYTGQEIIARMESREKLAKTIVQIELSQFIQAPATIRVNGQSIGTLTSSVVAPDGQFFAIGILKVAHTQRGTSITVGDDAIPAQVGNLLGTQPDFLRNIASPEKG